MKIKNDLTRIDDKEKGSRYFPGQVTNLLRREEDQSSSIYRL